jgi:hypothetical protein
MKPSLVPCDPALFEMLGENDFLFIDSSHVLRPQGDICHLYLSVLPKLRPGVIVHVHDVFTPRDYLEQRVSQGRLWNEHPVNFSKSPEAVVETVQAISGDAPNPFYAGVGERLSQKIRDCCFRHEAILFIVNL